MISYARPSGEIVTLSFDAETHLLAKYETLQATMMDGDVAFTHAYLGYRVVDGMQMPTGFEIRRGPWTLTRGTLNAVQLDQPSNDSDFEVPAYRQIASYDPPMQMETLSPGVHVVRYVPGGYNVLCIEFADHLLTMETPEDTSREGVSRQVVDFIHDKFPNKPVRYAVPTHHHVDHVGGARDYVATGATIISTKANEKVIRQLAAQRSTITPDTLDKANLPLKLQFIGESPLKFSDQEQELQVFAIGPTPHVKEILIGYLPKQKILFQTDLFNAWSCFKQQVPNESIGHTTALGDTQALIAAVERLGLEVDRVIGGHGLDVEYTWMKEFTQRRAKDGLPMWACTAGEMREAFGATH